MSFLDTLKKTAGAAAQVAAVTADTAVNKTKTMASIGRVKLAISSEEDKLKKAYTELGRLFYRDYEAQAEADMAEYLPWCGKAADAREQIQRLTEELEKLNEASVALLQNVRSQKSGKKDIIKIEGDISGLNFDVLGYVDPQISLTFIENGHVTRKVRPDQPKRLVNVIKCTNPRCITSLETGCDHIFALTPSGRYRCVYCEQEFKVRP